MWYLIIGLIIWLILGGGVGYAIGSSKGRGTAGFWLGFWLGFIGWIIVGLMGNTVDEDVRRARAIEASRRRFLSDDSLDDAVHSGDVSSDASPSPRQDYREVVYDTSDWPIESVASVCANLDQRNVDYYMEDTGIVVDARHEVLLDNLIAEVDTGPPDPESPRDGPPRVTYSTAAWSTRQLDLIVDRLGDHGVTYTFEDGRLVVDADAEALCDKLIIGTSDDR